MYKKWICLRSIKHSIFLRNFYFLDLDRYNTIYNISKFHGKCSKQLPQWFQIKNRLLATQKLCTDQIYMDNLNMCMTLCISLGGEGGQINTFAWLTAGCTWPLMLTVRNGELVERRLSHSLSRGSGTDSMKLLFSSLMLVWWRMISVWVLSRSYKEKEEVKTRRWKGKIMGEEIGWNF